MFRLTARLEQGQLADLYRATRDTSGETVALKLFHAATSDRGYAQVVQGFVQRLADAAHPGVTRPLEVGVVQGRLAIVYADRPGHGLGLVLQRLQSREVVVSPGLALWIVAGLADALESAHRVGVIHGAVTPGNVILGADGTISISDFGALEALQAAPSLARAFAERGRRSYRAPEVAAGLTATPASDVYALGAIGYELLTLHEATTQQSLSTRPVRLPAPSRLVRSLPGPIDLVIMRTLELDAGRRFGSAAAFAEAIRELLRVVEATGSAEELARFVAQVLPNEVQTSGAGPLPFTETFLLEPLGEASLVAQSSFELGPRPPFSGGAIDDRTPTSDGLPVFPAETGDETAEGPLDDVEAKTQRDVPQYRPESLADWEAPAGNASPAAQAGPTPAVSEALRDRVREVDDFSTVGPAPQPKPAPKPFPIRVAKTLMTFVVPFKRDGDPVVPSSAEREARAREKVRSASFLGALILMGTVGGAIAFFLRSNPDPRAAVVATLPAPIQRALPAAPSPPIVAAPRAATPPLPPLVEYEKVHPEKAFPAVPPLATNDADECYAASKGKVAYLAIRGPRDVKVEIDGKRVCGPVSKVAVSVGAHEVRASIPKGREDYVVTKKFEAGKWVKLTPSFRTR